MVQIEKSGMKGSFRQSNPHDNEREAAWRQSGFWSGRPLIEMVEKGAAAYPETRLTFSSADRPMSVGTPDLLSSSLRVAAGLNALGLERGDVIVAQIPHWAEGVQLLLASLRLGLVFVPVVHIYGPGELEFILDQTKARALVMPDRWRNIDYARRVAALGDLPALEHLIVLGDGAMPGLPARWSDLVDARHGLAPHTPGEPDDIAAINFTSGTTSAPKGVMHSQRSLEAEVRQSSVYIDRTSPGALLVTSPAGHIGGLSSSLRPFLSGENTIFLDRWDLDRALDAIHDHHAVRGICTPFHINALMESGRLPAHLSQLVVGGAGVSPTLITQADQLDIAACRSWGATEHPTVTTSLREDPLQARAFTDGLIMEGCEVRIVDEDGQPVPAGERGEIHSIGPDLFEGYLDANLNAAAFTDDGWYRTGDIGTLDDNGRVTIVDRKKDIIIRGGENISSKEVEDLLVQHSSVAEAAAVGWPDRVYGERVAAFVRLNEAGSLTLQDVVDHFRQLGVAPQKTPERIVLVDEFPRNLSGKILKPELRARISTLAAQD